MSGRLRTSETVAVETPARLATAWMFDKRLLRTPGTGQALTNEFLPGQGLEGSGVGPEG